MTSPGRRAGRKSSQLTRAVLAIYGRTCHICGQPGADTRDHLVPIAAGGLDIIDNCRPAHRSCNSRRQDRALTGYGASIRVIVGPPASGKSTYAAEHAGPVDLVIDFDAIAGALQPSAAGSREYSAITIETAKRARAAMIRTASRAADPAVTVWLIHAIPSPADVRKWHAWHWPITVIDPGRQTVEDRARRCRPATVWPAIAKWYDVSRRYVADDADNDAVLQPSRKW